MRSVSVLVGGERDSAAGVRARGLFGPLSDRYDVSYLYRDRGRGRSAVDFAGALVRGSPDVCYVVNPSVSGVWPAVGARIARTCPFIVDTGDLAYALARLVGTPGWPARQAIRLTEAVANRGSSAVVVRGTYHKELLERRGLGSVHLVRDGVDPGAYDRPRDEALRARLGIGGGLCLGMIGTLRWSTRLGMSYGWDLVEAFGLIDPALPVTGLVIGDGDGLAHLRARADELGVADRIRFVGSVPPGAVASYVQQLDIAISTQTDNDVGRVRTTGKLPEYMAAGCFVLATDVGEAQTPAAGGNAAGVSRCQGRRVPRSPGRPHRRARLVRRAADSESSRPRRGSAHGESSTIAYCRVPWTRSSAAS